MAFVVIVHGYFTICDSLLMHWIQGATSALTLKSPKKVYVTDQRDINLEYFYLTAPNISKQFSKKVVFLV